MPAEVFMLTKLMILGLVIMVTVFFSERRYTDKKKSEEQYFTGAMHLLGCIMAIGGASLRILLEP